MPITSILPLCYSHSLSGWSRPLVGIPVLPSLLLAERLTAATWVIPGAQRILPDTAGSLRKPHRLVGLADTLRVGRYSCRSRPLYAGVRNFTTLFPRASDASPGAPLRGVQQVRSLRFLPAPCLDHHLSFSPCLAFAASGEKLPHVCACVCMCGVV